VYLASTIPVATARAVNIATLTKNTVADVATSVALIVIFLLLFMSSSLYTKLLTVYKTHTELQ
jgi:hypothetical protein